MYLFICFMPGKHSLTGNVLSQNRGHGISYTSLSTESPDVVIAGSIITSNGDSLLPITQTGAIFFETANRKFYIYNNFIAENRVGGIFARLEGGYKLGKSQIYRNTILKNGKEALLLDSRGGQACCVEIRSNSFSHHKGYDCPSGQCSVCKMRDVMYSFTRNFFYNNSGLYIIEYRYPNHHTKENKVLENTLYINYGTGASHGVTILCDGPVEIHRNHLKNPSNLYEITSSMSGGYDVFDIDARSNWWGSGIMQTVSHKIVDRYKDNRLQSRVIFRPFQKLPSQHVISGKRSPVRICVCCVLSYTTLSAI